MSDNAVFTATCDAIQHESGLNRLEARGTVRLMMKEAGLAARDVTVHEMLALLDSLLPEALSTRGVAPDAPIARAREAIERLEDSRESPESLFEQMAGRRSTA